MRANILILPIFALVASCGANDVDSALQAARAKASIDTLWTRYAEASDQHDATAFAAIFTEDATFAFAGAPSVHGGKAIGDYLAARSANIDATGLRVLPEELKASGSLAMQSGTFERRFIESDSQKTEYGRYTLIAERGPGKTWRVRRLMGVADSVR